MSAIAAITRRALKTPGLVNEQLTPQQGPELEHVLLNLARFGRPRLSIPSKSGWYCSIDVSVTPTGAKFEVASDFDKETPIAAALECQQRLIAALAAFGGAA